MPSGVKPIKVADLKHATEISIRRAGARYTPAIDPSAPNLKIAPLVEAFDALSYSDSFKSRLLRLGAELREGWSGLSKELRQALSATAEASTLCSDLLTALRSTRLGSIPQHKTDICQIYDDIRLALQKYEGELRADRDKHADGKQERSPFDGKIEEARRLRQTLGKLGEFLSSTAFSVIYNNKLFLRGSWGTGKTHLLCDIANERVKGGLPTLLILAHTLPAGRDPLLAVLQAAGLGPDVDSALSDIDRLGQETGGRALILVDAINEGDRVAWNQSIEKVALLFEHYPNIGLVLSCRTPFEQQILNENTRQLFVMAVHTGFEEIEFDAQSTFFLHYDIPHPHIPLLAPEFSTPLFLKILCTSIAKLSQSAKKRRIKSFASGHKGMTKLLEDFVVEVGTNVEHDFNLRPKACWRILKGTGESKSAVGIAAKMADLMDDQIPLTDVIAIVSHITGFDDAKAGELITRLVNDGLLSKNYRIEAGVLVDTICLPYQRFSDHLISRHLLARHLDTKSAATIRNSFRPSRPLGKIFKPARWGGYEMPGLASAIMLEFPERVKRAVHQDRQELAFYLPSKLRFYKLSEPFIEGLLWRDIDSFSKQSDRLVTIFLHAKSEQTREAMLEALVSLASRSDHRYNAEKLRGYLWRMKLPDRDLFWTEFLRSRRRSSAAYRVLDWVQQPSSASMEEATATNLITLVSLFLTSTVRPFRDRATHCLVLLGERSPTSLFAEVSRSFTSNDPYVPERMLAAAYGVLMRKWAFPREGLSAAALPLALELRDRLVGTDDKAPIEHILMRDYAQGFVELTARLAPDQADVLLNDPRRVSPKTVLRAPSRISEKSVEGAKPAIHMDFGNYTIGRLVTNRRNYDDSHTGYRAIHRRIQRRILDLGYDAEQFRSPDRSIAEGSFYAHQSNDGQRTDRYGKKYSWIAFYEVAGRLALRGRSPDRWEARLSDTDIDPSFPAAPREWQPPLLDLFAKPFTKTTEWLQHGASPHYGNLLVLDKVDGQAGPWVLLDGFIGEASASDDRRTFTFLRGVLVKPEDLQRLHAAVESTEYPGNNAIPKALEDHYLFAGEIGWSDKYGYQSPKRAGRPHMEEAFVRHEAKRVIKRFGDLSPFERTRTFGKFPIVPEEEGAPLEDSNEHAEDDLVTIDEYEKIPGVMIEVLVRQFAWETYHSQENQSGSPFYPAPSLVRRLNLRKFGPQVDMVDQHSHLVTIYRVFDIKNYGVNSGLLYIHADVLKQYLLYRKMTLVWINWGEREIDYRTSKSLRDVPEVHALWGNNAHIHKEFFVYNSAERQVEKMELRVWARRRSRLNRRIRGLSNQSQPE